MTPETYCQTKVAQSGSSFYYSFIFLPESQKLAINALYAFCREVDDIVDETKEKIVAQKKLEWWFEEIERLYQGQPQHPVTRALFPYLKIYNWEKQWFKDILYGMHFDLNFQPFETFKDLEHYCYLVAGVVGVMASHIFGFKDEQTLTYAKNLGICLQLINIIRDVREDALRDRVYLPLEDLSQYNLSLDTILNLKEDNSAIRSVLNLQAERANAFYVQAIHSLPECDRFPQRSGIIMGQLYLALLEAMKESQFNVMTHRISLTPIRKLWIAWKTARSEKNRYKVYRKKNAD